MSRVFDVNNKFFTLMGKIFDLLCLNLIWVLLCIPMVTAVPATIALYYAVVKSVRRERGYAVKEFFRSFKMNFKQGAIASLVLFVLVFCLGIDFMWAIGRTGENTALWDAIFTNDNPLEVLSAADIETLRAGINFTWVGVFLVVSFIIFCLYNMLIPVLSRFQMKLLNAYKFSFAVSLKHFWVSVLSFLLWIVAVLSAVMTNGATALIIFAVAMLVESFMMEKVLKIYTERSLEEHKNEAQEENEEEGNIFEEDKNAKPWYLE